MTTFSNQNNPSIGVFDSGLGGLTVVRALRKTLPAENIIYLGDLAHLPYGMKSKREIILRSKECAEYLRKKKIKALVIACNSASSFAFSGLKRKYSFPVIDVIDPAAEEACAVSKTGKIGIIATQATIDSSSYTRILKKKKTNLSFYLKACPLLVPLVEEGWCVGSIAEQVVAEYLAGLKKKKIDTLILGCTHYPLLKNVMKKYLGSQINIVDSAYPTAKRVKSSLQSKGLLSLNEGKGRLKVYTTDYANHFSRLGEKFLGEPLKKIDLVTT